MLDEKVVQNGLENELEEKKEEDLEAKEVSQTASKEESPLVDEIKESILEEVVENTEVVENVTTDGVKESSLVTEDVMPVKVDEVASKTTELEIEEINEELELENKIFKEFLNGKSLEEISTDLNFDKVRDIDGNIKTWTPEKIKKIIESIKIKEAAQRKKLMKRFKEDEKLFYEKKQKEQNNVKLEQTNKQEQINKQEQVKKEDNNKNNDNKKISKAAKKNRRIILAVTLYLDAIFVFVFVAGGYLQSFLAGTNDFVGNLTNNVGFTTAVLLLVVFLIINIVALGLYKDAKKIRGKKADNLLPMIDEMENFDGRREVEEELVEEVKGPVYRNSKTIESINIKKVQDDLIYAALQAGVVVDKKTARNVLASIASCQLIFVKEENKELCSKFLKVLSRFFGVEYYETKVLDTATTFESIGKTYDGQGSSLTPFSKSILAANQLPESVNLSVLTNVDPSKMMSYFKEVFAQVKNPNLNAQVKIGSRSNSASNRPIPKNFWTICVVKDEEYEMPSEIAKYSISLELNLKESEETVESKTFKPISYPQIVDCVSELYEMCYIEEDVWKHLDEFEEYLSNRGDYFVDNRILRQMERYAAIYLALDGEQADVVDTLLSQKLLLIALPNEYKKLDPSEETVVGNAEKILGADFISHSQELLKKIKMN